MKKLSTVVLAFLGSYAMAQSQDQQQTKELFPYSTELQEVHIPLKQNTSLLEYELNDTLFSKKPSPPRYLFYQDLLDIYYQNFHNFVGPVLEPNLFPNNEAIRLKLKRADLRQVRYGLYYDWGDDMNRLQRERIEQHKRFYDSLDIRKEEKTPRLFNQ